MQGSADKKGQKGPTTQNLDIRTVKGDKVFNDSAQKSVATCDSDEVLTGGGSEHFGASYQLVYIKPVGNSWEAKSLPMSQDPSYTQAYAQCQKLVPNT